ncbi:MAG: hypothetical protein ACOC7L_00825 [Acidobacteriota bacterium]
MTPRTGGGAGPAALLRAFLWLRWRTLANSLASRRRETSRALGAWAEVLGRGLLWVTAGSAALGLSAGALVVPWALAPERDLAARAAVLLVLRVGLGFFTVLVLVVPAFQGFAEGSFGRTRLLLLPVPRRLLHAAEVGSHLADPWILMIVAPLAAVAVGALPVATVAVPVVVVAGVLFVVAVASLSTCVSFGVELLLRDRRRAEAAAGVLMVLWLVGVMVPGLLDGAGEVPDEGPAGMEAPSGAEIPAEEGTFGEPAPGGVEGSSQEGAAGSPYPEPIQELDALARFPLWLQVLPSEAYTRVLALSAAGRPWAALLPTAILGFVAWCVVGFSRLLWRPLLASPDVSATRVGSGAFPRPMRLPALAPAASAVGWAHLRGVLRTVAGRLALVLAPVMTLLLVFFVRTELSGAGDGSAEGFVARVAALPSGVAGALLAFAASLLCILGLQAVLLNQFAVDGAGWTLSVVLPVGPWEHVLGRAAAGGVLVFAQVLLATGVVVSFQPAALAFWPAVILGAASAYALLAPANAWLSMLLPKAADLSRLGKRAQPNQVAALAGMFATPLAGLPALAVGAGTLLATGSAAAVTLAEAAWAGVALCVGFLLLRLAARTLPARQESIVLALEEGA